MTERDNRNRIIIRTSIIGILANVFLAASKAVIGVISNSIAIVMDAVNNLSDAASSIITIIGTKLAGKEADREHPFGYGRIEYLSAMVISLLVLYAGITAFIESVKKIIHPEAADYSTVSLIIIAVAIAVKLALGSFFKKQGEKVNSGALIASGSDASFDAVLSASVLASAIIYLLFHISLEAYVGVVIAIFIIRAGLEMLSETLDDILGKRNDEEIGKQIRKLIREEPEIRGAYDLILYNYGPNKNYGSVHIELPDTMTVEDADIITRKVQAKVYRETGVILTGVGVYSFNTTNKEAVQIRNAVQKAVFSHDWALQMHGFYADTEKKTIRFDVVVSFDVRPEEAVGELYQQIHEMYPEYELQIIPDIDVLD